MALLTVSQLRKSFGTLQVLKDATFSVGAGHRAALVGPNGCGKSTLVRIIVGREAADSGHVALLPGTRAGYLPQEVTEIDGADCLGAVLAGEPAIVALERELIDLEAQMTAAEGPELTRLAGRYGERQAEFERLGGYAAEARAKTLLAGLGFTGDQLHKPVAVMSGGQKTRIYLARLLYQAPELLLLDEPTNHLDLGAVEWLEEHLRAWTGTLLLVSHDRAFLDRVADHVIDLSGGRAVSYRGNYSDYARQKAFNDEQQLEAYERQQEEIGRLQNYIDRYRAGNRSRQAKSRQKWIDRLDRIERPDSPDGIRFKFVPAHPSGREALTLRGVSKSYGPLRLFTNLDLFVARGDRVGVVGPNGAGKSTLIRCLLGEERFDSGDVYPGHNVHISTLSQHAEELDLENTVLDELMDNSTLKISEARDLLGQFLFQGDDVFKPIGALSGGERNRLLLARLLAERPNFLLLDEPTNHLDLWCREALERALKQYTGTVIFASHDRYLLSGVATRILEIKGGQARAFDLTWDEFREREAAASLRSEPVASRPKAAAPAKPSAKPVSAEKRLKQIEREISPLEARLAEVTALMADPETYTQQGQGRALSEEYDLLTKQLELLYADWETVADQVAA